MLDKDVRNALRKLKQRETAAVITVMKHSVNIEYSRFVKLLDCWRLPAMNCAYFARYDDAICLEFCPFTASNVENVEKRYDGRLGQ